MKNDIKENKALSQTSVITRFFRELFKPSLKCERLGHKLTTKSFRIRKRSNGYGICTDFNAKIDICSRCNNYHSEFYDLEELNTYTSVSMPSSYWESIRKNGYVVMD